MGVIHRAQFGAVAGALAIALAMGPIGAPVASASTSPNGEEAERPFVRVTFICVVAAAGGIEQAPGTFSAGDRVFRIREEAGVGSAFSAGVGAQVLFSGSVAPNETQFHTTPGAIAGIKVTTTPEVNLYRGTASSNSTSCTASVTPSPTPTPTPTPTTDPDPSTWVDLDDDGLPDQLEAKFGSSPTLVDTDSDGLNDGDEFLSLTDPNSIDTDGDGTSDALDDTDADGLNNQDEIARGTTPYIADTDGDGMSDGDEVQQATSPLDSDSDNDGVTDGDELALGSNPTVADTDSDGILDGEDLFSRELVDSVTGASLTVSGPGASVLSAELRGSTILGFEETVGRAAAPVEVIAEEGVTGTLRIPFDATQYGPGSDLSIVHFDESSGTFDAPLNQSVDYGAGIASVTTDDFSPFVLVESAPFAAAWNMEFRDFNDGYQPADYVIAFDSLDSFATADPNDRLKPAVGAFISELPDDSRISVMNFDGRVVQPFSLDHADVAAAVAGVDDPNPGAAAVCPIDVSDETGNLWCTARTAMFEFNNTAFSRPNALVLLTDGLTPPESDRQFDLPVVQAEHNSVTVYVVGVGGESSPEDWTDELSYLGQGDNYFDAGNTDELGAALEDLAARIEATRLAADSDSDGVPDYLETGGVLTGFGTSLTTDANNPDTDGDGLTDGDELGPRATNGSFGTGNYFPAKSDPTKPDTDGDGIGDAQERDLETQPRMRDSDLDRLDDLMEVSIGFDPVRNDSDRDFRFDDREWAEGTDPLLYDFDTLGNVHAAFSGLVFGDAWDTGPARALNVDLNVASNGWYLVGQIGSGLLVLGDLRDLVGGVGSGNVEGAIFAAIGIVPLFGDALRISTKVTSFAQKSSAAVYAAVPFLKVLPTEQRFVVARILAQGTDARFALDKVVRPTAPRANFDIDLGWVDGVMRRISNDTVQAGLLEDILTDLQRLHAQGVPISDVRVNQNQVNAAGARVGINRPDLQYTMDGRRYYIEIDRPRCGSGNAATSRRGDAHAQRLFNNDPGIVAASQIILIIAGNGCD